MVVGDDIYYKKHDFDLLPYIRQKPIDDSKYQYCLK